MKKSLLTLAIATAIAAPAFAQQTFSTGVDATFPPHSMAKLGGGVEGYFIEVGNEVARRLGGKLNIESAAFSGLIPGLAAKKYDWLLPTTATKERAANMLFTEGYVDTDYQFLVKKSDPDIKSLDELRGKKIAVNKGSIFDRWCAENAAARGFGCDIYDTTADAIQAVLSGRAATALASDAAIKWAGKQNPLTKPTFTIKTGQVFAISTSKDNVALRNRISMAIKCMKQDGTLAKFHVKWLGVAPAPDSTINNIGVGHGVPGLEGYDPTPVTLTCS